MNGNIRALVGFLMVFGSVGGLDNGSSVLACIALGTIGLILMASGVRAMKRI